MFLLILPLVVSLAADDERSAEPGFGGAADADADVDDEPDDSTDLSATDFPHGAPRAPSSGPGLVVVELAPKKTQLELDLERAHLDPEQFPLLELRVDVARLAAELDEKESHGLSAARDVETRLAAAQALLADAERIGLHRLNVCATRTARGTSAKNFRMTAAGPIRLTTSELLSQANALDPDGCARIELVDEALVQRLRRAHEVRNTLLTVSFPYHRIAERRALEAELKVLEKQLAQEDLPVLSMPGMKDPGR